MEVNLEASSTAKTKEGITCNLCDTKISNRGNLKTHQRFVHANEKNFLCNVCDKDFYDKGHYLQHVDTVHGNKRKFKCELCPKTYKQIGCLKRHFSSNHENSTKVHKCEFCDHVSKNERHLKIITVQIVGYGFSHCPVFEYGQEVRHKSKHFLKILQLC